MAKLSKNKELLKKDRKEIKAAVIAKLTEALKEYKTPHFDKKLTKKIMKAGKSISAVLLKGKKEAADFVSKKSA
jgi:hypothetical protein